MLNQPLKWVTHVLQENGYHLVGKPNEVRSMPWSSVFCFPTTAGLVYLKCMEPDFAYEPRVIQFLCQQGLTHLPTIIAANDKARCFLMKDAGEPLRGQLETDFDIKKLCTILTIYAELQIDCIPYTHDLLKIGVLDFRLITLPHRYRELTADKSLLLSVGLAMKEISDLENLSEIFEQRRQNLAQFAIPETLDHGDFHDNNVLIKESAVTINDFGDAAISHPFFSIAAFLNSLQRHHSIKTSDKVYLILRDAYLEPWGGYLEKAPLIQTFNIANGIRSFAWALSFLRIWFCPRIREFPKYQNYLADGLRTLINNMMNDTRKQH